MTRSTVFFVFATVCLGATDEPVLQSWLVNPNANPALKAILPEVHSVEATPHAVFVRSAGLSLQSFGALEANTYEVPSGIRQFTFRIPRQPKPATDRPATPLGIIGAFVTGMPLYNLASTASYRDQNLWHRDAVAAINLPRPALLSALLAASSRHSPLIGYALDGYPIYGPYGPAGQRNRSSYQLRRITQRTAWPDGTQLTPGQAGPAVNAEFPLGTFIEDYEYVPGSGDLDQSNARWAITPEYPRGTWAYFLSTNATGQLTYPHLVGPVYRGQIDRAAKPTGLPQVGQPFSLRFDVRNQAGRLQVYLEKVHEMPLHLLIISDDLSDFAHVHPTPVPGGGFALDHTFAAPGRYHLYADSVVAGAAPTVQHTTVTVSGPAPLPTKPPSAALQIELTFGAPLRTGVDLPLTVKLPVTDLDPYLGAWAHFVVVSADHQDFIHAHPQEAMAASGVHDHAAVSGPSPEIIRTSIGFRRPGKYRLWAQFQRAGQGIVLPFDLEVAPGNPPEVTRFKIPKDAIRVAVSAAGFTPARLEVAAGRPVRLAFSRLDAQNCGGIVQFPEIGLKKMLPPGQITLVEFTSPKSGELSFPCGMGMMRGAVVIR